MRSQRGGGARRELALQCGCRAKAMVAHIGLGEAVAGKEQILQHVLLRRSLALVREFFMPRDRFPQGALADGYDVTLSRAARRALGWICRTRGGGRLRLAFELCGLKNGVAEQGRDRDAIRDHFAR